MIRRPPRSTLDRSSAASDVYKRQDWAHGGLNRGPLADLDIAKATELFAVRFWGAVKAVSYTHLRAHETVLDLVCRLLLEKKN